MATPNNFKGRSRRCNFAPWDKGQCPHGALFHAAPGCCKSFRQRRIAGTASSDLGHRVQLSQDVDGRVLINE